MKQPGASESGPTEPIPIAVLGSVALDTIETPTVRRERLLGGSATYFAAATRLFAPVEIVSVVGEDFRSADEVKLRDLGIDTAMLERLPGRTYAWHGRYGSDYANAATVARDVGVIDDYTPPAGAGRRGGGLFLGAFAPAIQRRVLDSSPATLTALDSRESWIAESPVELIELAARVDLVFLNLFELAALTGRDSVADGARDLLDRGANCVVVKRGAAGATLYADGEALSVPAFATTVVDPTGAGDAFAGGFMGTLASSGRRDADALGEALRQGAALASFTLESLGIDALAKLTRDELDRRAGAIEWRQQEG